MGAPVPGYKDCGYCVKDGVRGDLGVWNPNNNMDDKVEGCPYNYEWISCCNVCGTFLQTNGTIKKGWGCYKDLFSTGVWLKGCEKLGTCE